MISIDDYHTISVRKGFQLEACEWDKHYRSGRIKDTTDLEYRADDRSYHIGKLSLVPDGRVSVETILALNR